MQQTLGVHPLSCCGRLRPVVTVIVMTIAMQERSRRRHQYRDVDGAVYPYRGEVSNAYIGSNDGWDPHGALFPSSSVYPMNPPMGLSMSPLALLIRLTFCISIITIILLHRHSAVKSVACPNVFEVHWRRR